RYNQFAKVRQDLWGADIIACRLQKFDYSGIAIQCTSATNHVARVKKALENPDVRLWLGMGIRFCVYSWGKHVVNKRKLWDKVPRITHITVNGQGLKASETPDPCTEARERQCCWWEGMEFDA